MVEVVEASTPEERERVYRFRYSIFVEERGKRFHSADHADRSLRDDWDDASTILYAREGDEIVGSLRGNRLDQCRINPDLAEALCIDVFLKDQPIVSLNMCSRFVIAPAFRHSLAAPLLILEIYRRALRTGSSFYFLHCAPGLIGLYEQLGFRRYSRNFTKDDTGIQVPMVLVIRDFDHLRRVSSPFLSAIDESGADPIAARWFEEAFPAQRRFLNRKVMDGPAFWRALADGSSRPIESAVTLFRDLSETEVQSFAASSTVHSFEPGESIIRAHDSGDEMYAILSGVVDVLGDRTGPDNVLRSLGPGEVFGEMSLFNRSIRTATVVASTAVTVLVITHGSIAKAMQKDPATTSRLVLNLARVLSHRLDSLTARVSLAHRTDVVS